MHVNTVSSNFEIQIYQKSLIMDIYPKALLYDRLKWAFDGTKEPDYVFMQIPV